MTEGMVTTNGPDGRSRTPNGSNATTEPFRQNVACRIAESPGNIIKFSLEVFRELPVALRLYPAEVVKHAGLLVRQNVLVIVSMSVFYAVILSLNVHSLFAKLGIGSYIGAAFALGDVRGVLQIVFGWIVAAKVGCGIVAELGAMRISEEIDAMEVMGVRSVAYLAGTRLLAGVVVAPLVWVITLLSAFIMHLPLNVGFLNTTSLGGFKTYFFLFQNSFDLIGSTVWATVMVIVIILVSCYYGYTAQGGPVGVGRNTAQSMLVNLVLISFIAMAFVQLLYGNAPNSPIAN